MPWQRLPKRGTKLRDSMTEETQLHYNGMPKSTGSCSGEVQNQAQARADLISAQRDLALATLDLQSALFGGEPEGPDFWQRSCGCSTQRSLRLIHHEPSFFTQKLFAGTVASVAGLAVARSALAGLPEPVIQTSTNTAPLVPNTGRPYKPCGHAQMGGPCPGA